MVVGEKLEVKDDTCKIRSWDMLSMIRDILQVRRLLALDNEISYGTGRDGELPEWTFPLSSI
jgi:hypothetical protein